MSPITSGTKSPRRAVTRPREPATAKAGSPSRACWPPNSSAARPPPNAAAPTTCCCSYNIPQVIGAARRYEISGDLRFHDVADYFWYEVTTARSYATTGTSNGEGWLTQPRMLAAELKRSAATAECCCSYNMLKLARHLYSWSGDASYFDYYERSLLNMRLGTIQPKTGHTQYYVSLTPGTWKTFNTEDKSFWCCTGSGVEEYSKLNDSIYWRDEEGIF